MEYTVVIGLLILSTIASQIIGLFNRDNTELEDKVEWQEAIIAEYKVLVEQQQVMLSRYAELGTNHWTAWVAESDKSTKDFDGVIKA